jgi:glucose-6-phosphate isomerase
MTSALLLGMGGSSLAPEVFRKTFGVAPGFLDLAILDSTDPGAVLERRRSLDPATTLYIVSTKSGGTVETLSLLKYFYSVVVHALGPGEAGRHFIAVTDPGSGLADLARSLGFRHVFYNDPHIGGRYSALSCFGLVPAALMGVDCERLLENARRLADAERASAPEEGLCAASLGCALGELARKGRDKLTLLLPEDIPGFGDWLEQLIAESTGKRGMGILPVVGEPWAFCQGYGRDRFFVAIQTARDPLPSPVLEGLTAAGHPVAVLEMDDAYDLGAQCLLWELATAVAGERLGINPFDQPDVEAAKVLARQVGGPEPGGREVRGGGARLVR